MRCSFCQTEYAEDSARCPHCGMREDYAQNKAKTTSAEAANPKRIRRNPLGYFWSAFCKYASIRGRACRTEYFWFMFFAFACWIGLAYGLGAILTSSVNGEEIVEYLGPLFYWLSGASEPALIPGAILGIILFVPPMLSLFARRLHDVGLSGWYVVVLFSIQSIFKSLNLDLFESFVPLFLLFWPGTKGENAYGPDPRRATTSDRKES